MSVSALQSVGQSTDRKLTRRGSGRAFPATLARRGSLNRGVGERYSVSECGSPLSLSKRCSLTQKRQPPPRRSGALARRAGGKTGAVQNLAALRRVHEAGEMV